jgi:hypothetical protein
LHDLTDGRSSGEPVEAFIDLVELKKAREQPVDR